MVIRPKDDVVVFVEGGGNGHSLRQECREAFASYFVKTVLGNKRRPRVVASGSRSNAYRDFCTAKAEGRRSVLLLVDSECAVAACNQPPHPDGFKPWAHLRQLDNWAKPQNATDEDCHLMVQSMESWFVADWDNTARFFGQGFNGNMKPSGGVETIAKIDIYTALKQASSSCKTKAPYGKGAHSFKLLAMLEPDAVLSKSAWAKRFIDELQKRKP